MSYLAKALATVHIASNATSVTLTAGVDYPMPADPIRAFVRVRGILGMNGNDSGAIASSAAIVGATVDQSDIGSSVVVTRSTTSITNVAVQLDYVESLTPGGDDDLIVRGSGVIQVASGSASGSSAAIAGVVDASRLWLILTGQRAEGTGTPPTQLHTLSWDAVNSKVVATRGGTPTTVSDASYVAVELVGSNWGVEQVSHSFAAAGVDETVTLGTDVGDLSRAFVDVQYRVASATNARGLGALAYLTATNTLTCRLATSATLASQAVVVWVVRNSRTTGTPLKAQRFAPTALFAGGPTTDVRLLTTPVASLTNVSFSGICLTSDGNNTQALEEVLTNLTLTDTSTVSIYRLKTSNNNTLRADVVEWPAEPTNTAPTVTIAEAGQALPVGASFDYTASASDAEDGDLTASIAWSVSDAGVLEITGATTGGSVTVKKIGAGSAQLLADVTDSNGTPATQASVTISDPATSTGFDKARFIIHALGGIV